MIDEASSGPRMYRDLASWWPPISPVEDYREEAAFIGGLFARAEVPVVEILELGSGGGHVARHLQDRFNPRDTWLGSLEAVGFSPDSVLDQGREIFLGLRPR